MTFETYVANFILLCFVSIGKKSDRSNVTQTLQCLERSLAVPSNVHISGEEIRVSVKHYASGNGTAVNQFYYAQPFGDLHNLTILVPRNGGFVVLVHLYNRFDLVFMFIIIVFFFMPTLTQN
jgi:hypothetical protein